MFIKKLIYTLFGASAFLIACAQIVAPNGGPEDKTTPVFVETFPKPYTLNFDKKSISVEFNKYMDRNSVIENLTILPSVPYTYDWSGKELEITFEEPLKKDLTYSITFGADMADYYRIKAAESLSLVFATGSKIDSGKVTGKIFDEKAPGSYVFAYLLDGVNPDTLNPATKTPDYKIQIGGAGTYSFNSMKDGKYRLFAVRDELKDGLINETSDQFICAGFDCVVKDAKSDPVNFLKYRRYDKTPPRLFGAEAINDKLVRVSFSENIKNGDYNFKDFSISDSLKKHTANISAAYTSAGLSSNLDLVLSTPLDTGIKYVLLFKDVNSMIADSSGNWLKDTLQQTVFTAPRDKDIVKPFPTAWPCSDSAVGIKRDSIFRICFNVGISDSILSQRFVIKRIKDSTIVPISISKSAANMVSIKPDKPYENGELYLFTFKSKGISSLTGIAAVDTTINLRFVAADEGSNGSANGILLDSTFIPGQKILVFEEKGGSAKYFVKPDSKGKWEIKSIKPGMYKISAFIDVNGDGRYESGYPYPFKPAAPFFLLDKEMVIAPRWTQADVKITLKR